MSRPFETDGSADNDDQQAQEKNRLQKREIYDRTEVKQARFLNRLLFTGVSPATRYTVFQRFYRHPLPTIARFYAGRTTRRDRARMVVGKPPRGFSLKRAMAGKAYA